MNPKVDLTNGVTKQVIQALEEAYLNKCNVEPTNKDMAFFLNVGVSTWGNWKTRANAGNPVHRNSALCKIIKVLGDSAIMPPKKSLKALDPFLSKLPDKKTDAAIQKKSNSYAYLLKPQWWANEQPYDLRDVIDVLKDAITIRLQALQAQARSEIVAIAERADLRVTFA